MNLKANGDIKRIFLTLRIEIRHACEVNTRVFASKRDEERDALSHRSLLERTRERVSSLFPAVDHTVMINGM